jgi:hypothetical protein
LITFSDPQTIDVRSSIESLLSKSKLHPEQENPFFSERTDHGAVAVIDTISMAGGQKIRAFPSCIPRLQTNTSELG